MDLMSDAKQNDLFLKKITNRTLQLTSQCSQESEVSIIKTTGINVSTRYGNVENIEFDNNEILKITVFFQHKKGIVFLNNLSEQSIIDAVHYAVDIARYASIDLYSGIADKELLAFNPVYLDLCHPIELDIKSSIQLASRAENTALNYDRRIICTEGGRFSSHITTVIFGNSHGMLSSYSSSQYFLSCNVIAESNGVMEQDYSYTLSRVFKKLRSPEWVGKECARRVLMHLNSRKINTIESPVLFTSETAVSLLQHLANAIHGDNIYKQSTFLLNDLGKKIFPSWFCIKEIPHVSQELGSAPFDDEGVQTLNKSIVKNGILNSWLLNTYSANKIGLKSTGNAGGIHNWYVSCQNISFMELIKIMNRGLIITNLMGQGVNIVTGDYSRGASGFWVNHGEIQYPVHEITVSGNLRQMFLNVNSISNDIETRSNIHCGSILINAMQIAGT
ncbi:putative modulator of DNA gyrase [Candidatus Blochmanniella vafra str. BVAF]|uniref:Modulator of DNA gyrase n=1 Tax=Blochmanniella vafra (strain BVAF) TaxID=859654 RepID=E8Q6V2_BLOVB|nr:metalloprotease PmbA [Candidatus Blochmannia vafer]ADV33699.1 putative modulator of DNA gyrase [Candidatus Blochmannia vafer str. BVAF]